MIDLLSLHSNKEGKKIRVIQPWKLSTILSEWGQLFKDDEHLHDGMPTGTLYVHCTCKLNTEYRRWARRNSGNDVAYHGPHLRRGCLGDQGEVVWGRRRCNEAPSTSVRRECLNQFGSVAGLGTPVLTVQLSCAQWLLVFINYNTTREKGNMYSSKYMKWGRVSIVLLQDYYYYYITIRQWEYTGCGISNLIKKMQHIEKWK